MEAEAAAHSQAQVLHLQRFSPENVAHNGKQLYYIRSVMTSVAGSAAGVFGLTNLDGFYCYLISLLITNLAILAINVRFRPSRYLLKFNPAQEVVSKGITPASSTSTNPAAVALSYISFLAEGAQEMAFGFVLWWTLWTAIIHVYD